jgi:hypothetical protein
MQRTQSSCPIASLLKQDNFCSKKNKEAVKFVSFIS